VNYRLLAQTNLFIYYDTVNPMTKGSQKTVTTLQPTRINLLIDSKLAQILNYFRVKNPLLKDVDIIRMAIGQSYMADIEKLPTHTLTNDEEESLKLALEDQKQNKQKYKAYLDATEMVNDMLADKI
jgi:hypothetical protein